MTQKLNIASSIRVCLAALLFAAAVGSACFALSPSAAFADAMPDGGCGHHPQSSDCCSTESLQRADCCTKAPATADAPDRVTFSLALQPATISSPNCSTAAASVPLGGSPPTPVRPAAPLRL